MTDIYEKSKRSLIMSKILGKDTRPEILVRKRLFAAGFRYKKNDKSLPGKPDIVIPNYGTAIFIHGCFWHGHEGCKASKLPETRKDFWEQKIRENIRRDQRNIEELGKRGWKVIVIWQCEINNSKKREKRLESLSGEIKEKCKEPLSCQERLKAGQSLYS